MKTSLFHGLLCASLIVFAVGCGKENKSGGEAASPVNPYTGSVPAASQSALKNFQDWYNSSTEGSYPGIGQKIETRIVQNYSRTDGCETKPITIFGYNITEINYCFSNSTSVSNQETDRVVNVLVSQVKSQNTKLAQAYAGSGMTLANATSLGQSRYGGTIYQLEYSKSNGHRVVYIIDTGVNSAFNPVQITDSEAKTVEFVEDIR